jgi:hypothetical protein
MAVTPSGAISLAAVNTALNRTTTAPISIGDFQVRFLANQDFGSVNMNAMRNKQSTVGTVFVGGYDDGKNNYFGYIQGFIGGASSNSFFGFSVVELYTSNGFVDVISAGGGTLGNVPARMTVNNAVIKSMALEGTAYVGYGTPTLFNSSMVGGTYSFQFAQT